MLTADNYRNSSQIEPYKDTITSFPESMFLMDKNFIGIFNTTPALLVDCTVNEITRKQLLTYNNISHKINSVIRFSQLLSNDTSKPEQNKNIDILDLSKI